MTASDNATRGLIPISTSSVRDGYPLSARAQNPFAPTTSPNPSDHRCLVPAPHIKTTPLTGHSIRGEWTVTAPSDSYVELPLDPRPRRISYRHHAARWRSTYCRIPPFLK